jgi:4,5-dihydroxyphthalate decarboxylase
MADLPFSLATGSHERGRPLAEGRVRAEGLSLTAQMFRDNGARHERFLKGEYDAAEFSFALYLSCWSRKADFAAIPVFLNRQFRHGAIFVNAKAGIREPRDLVGKRIGVMSWANTAALWGRGLLQFEYGLDLAKVQWITAETGEVGKIALPPGVTLTPAPSPKMVELLLAGEIDAMITPRTLARDHGPVVVRLFPNFADSEAAFYKKTGVFPASHALVVRTALLEKHPWLAASLFQAFCEARELAHHYADDPEQSTLAWFGAEYEREVAILGKDPDAYGIEPNRKMLETLVQYGYGAALLSQRPAIEELFHPSARNLVPKSSREKAS